MKHIKRFTICLMLILFLSGCKLFNNDPNYINLDKAYKRNGSEIEKVMSYIDYPSKSNTYVVVGNRFEEILIYNRFSKVFGFKMNFKRIAYLSSPERLQPIAYEIKNETKAIEYFKKTGSFKEAKILISNNIIYVDTFYANILLNNSKLEGDNYLTLDGKSLLTNISNDETIYIPNVEEIKMHAYLYRSNLKKIYMSDTVMTICNQAFYGSENLEHVFLNYELNKIDDAAFYNCKSLKYMVVPESVEYVGYHAFNYGIIYCEAESKPDGWDNNFYCDYAMVYYKGQWKYDANGIPKPNLPNKN